MSLPLHSASLVGREASCCFLPSQHLSAPARWLTSSAERTYSVRRSSFEGSLWEQVWRCRPNPLCSMYFFDWEFQNQVRGFRLNLCARRSGNDHAHGRLRNYLRCSIGAVEIRQSGTGNNVPTGSGRQTWKFDSLAEQARFG
jgi:hypothetical protein